MAVLLKQNEMMSIVKNGVIFRHFNKGEWNERFAGGMAQEVLRHFCVTGSGKQENSFTKIKWNHQKRHYAECRLSIVMLSLVAKAQKACPGQKL